MEKITNDIIRKTYRNEEIPNNLILKLQEQQRTGYLCDYELKTEDGGSFKVHKWVLSPSDESFVALFNDNNFDNSKLNSLLVPYASANILEKVIGFIYTGVIELSSDFAKEVINAALFLNINTLVDYCIEILIQTLNDKNCWELLKFSETCAHYGRNLTEESLKLVCKNFNAFVNSPDFCELSSITMKILVKQSRIAYSEEDLYLAVFKWIDFDTENRKKLIHELIDNINFKDLNNDFAKSLSKTLSSITIKNANNTEVTLLQLKTESEQKNKNTPVNCVSNTEVNPRDIKLESGEKSLHIFLNRMLMSYDKLKNEFSEIITRMEDTRFEFGCTTFGKDKVFICGGRDVRLALLKQLKRPVDTCKYFSMQNKCWVDLPSLNVARYAPNALTVDDEIYVFGGYSVLELIPTVELFDINTSVWSQKCSLKNFDNEYSFSNGACHLNKSIYFVHRNCVQRLDPKVNQWEILYNQKTNFDFCSVEAYDNFIYAFNLDYISTFDIRTNKWMEHKVEYKQKYFQLPITCEMDNRIYVLGISKQNEKNKYCLKSFLPFDLSLVDSHVLGNNEEIHPEAFFSI